MKRVCEHCGALEGAVATEHDMCPAMQLRKRHRFVVNLKPETGLGVTASKRAPSKGARSGFTPASKEQRAKNQDERCVVCAETPTDPAHLIDRSLTDIGQEDPLATIPLCRMHHRQYDDHQLDLLPYEAAFAEEMGFAVKRYGSIPTINRVSCTRWASEAKAA